ncbi:DegV family protein [Ilumatobacter sp.]|uniref:DegV family protein n=1 Tax=Ilumatobacter sp. TaxID=1967498 RepID=UPI003B515882
MIGIVVDSNSQMPAELARRHSISVVPLTVTVDGVDHLEGVDLDADGFYALFDGGVTPEVSTSQPSPGRFAAAYAALVASGATEILSIHIAEAMSGTVNSARIGAAQVDVPVRLVDTGTASFGIACCAWAAAEVVASGGGIDEAAELAETLGRDLRTTFVVGVPALIDRSGRATGADVAAASGDGVAVVAMTGSDMSVLASVTDLDAAVDVMVDDALARPPSAARGLRIAVGTSDDASAVMSDALAARLDGRAEVAEVVRYRIGPSVGAHTGPGTCGLFVF